MLNKKDTYTSCNGYVNYPTFIIALTIDNSRELSKKTLTLANSMDSLELSLEIKKIFDKYIDDLKDKESKNKGLNYDLFNATFAILNDAIDKINYYQIADHIKANVNN